MYQVPRVAISAFLASPGREKTRQQAPVSVTGDPHGFVVPVCARLGRLISAVDCYLVTSLPTYGVRSTEYGLYLWFCIVATLGSGQHL
ncbi:hypothetical protein IF1G_08734 [Cordyceps javanica]|uniref:Uncharacterized protein n=1 Tax=Cordyceps javanica TaxID=43265 RepID=A0A545UTN7_9HYPO|nr:hypothetical protein IF1G_08734 [Cordyceps javanica]